MLEQSILTTTQSITWFSYRSNMPRIGQTYLTSDLGWGCMIRCGQMILCQGLTRHIQGKEFIYNHVLFNESKREKYLLMMKLFSDRNTRAPFSIH